jgi:rRNA maturation RNase YbeY
VTYRVQISLDPPVDTALDLQRLERLVRMVLSAEGARSCEIGVVLTDNAGIQALNYQYRGKDTPTDVLAFSMQEQPGSWPPAFSPEKGPPYLGDVVVSLEQAREQAAVYEHSWSHEVDLLVIHGLLHLLGYDDEDDFSRLRMAARQERLLAVFVARRSRLVDSFGAAFAGLGDLFRTQRNARIHAVIVAAVLVVGLWLGLSLIEWALLVLTIALVFVAEILNTALESLVDLASPENRPLARRSKDLAAAAVLVTAILSVVMGLLVFLPRLWELLS